MKFLFMDFTLKKYLQMCSILKCKKKASWQLKIAVVCQTDKIYRRTSMKQPLRGRGECHLDRCSVHVTHDFVHQNSSNCWLARGWHLIEVRLYLFCFFFDLILKHSTITQIEVDAGRCKTRHMCLLIAVNCHSA